MNFEEYISYTGLIVLYIDYTKESTKTLDQVRDIAVSRCNRVASSSKVDVKCYVTDHHNGNKYIAYSDAMVKKYSVLHANWQLDLDMESIDKLLSQPTTPIPTTPIPTTPTYENPIRIRYRDLIRLGNVISIERTTIKDLKKYGLEPYGLGAKKGDIILRDKDCAYIAKDLIVRFRLMRGRVYLHRLKLD